MAGPLAGLPLLALVGDQQAALLGQACVQPGEAKCTYGTGAFLLANTGTRRPEPASGLLASPAYQADDAPAVYCLEGATAVAGRAVGWLAGELGILPDAASSAAVAATVSTSAGVRVVPAFQGLYAPWWDATARGAILGLTLHSTGAHVVRATLEALAFQTRAVLEAAEADAALHIPELRVDGGATANPVLLQALADALGRPVTRALDPEATVRGAAFAAGLAAGLWTSPAVARRAARPGRDGAARVGQRPARDGVRRLAPRRRPRPRLGLTQARSRAIRSAWVSRRTTARCSPSRANTTGSRSAPL